MLYSIAQYTVIVDINALRRTSRKESVFEETAAKKQQATGFNSTIEIKFCSN